MSGKMGERYNNGKPMLSLIPAYAMEEVAKVLTYGATKYSKNNWLKGRPWMEFVDSLERHLQAWKRGEDIDEESGCLHAAHLACNALMLVELIKIRPDLDDRPKEFYTQIENRYLKPILFQPIPLQYQGCSEQHLFVVILDQH